MNVSRSAVSSWLVSTAVSQGATDQRSGVAAGFSPRASAMILSRSASVMPIRFAASFRRLAYCSFGNAANSAIPASLKGRWSASMRWAAKSRLPTRLSPTRPIIYSPSRATSRRWKPMSRTISAPLLPPSFVSKTTLEKGHGEIETRVYTASAERG